MNCLVLDGPRAAEPQHWTGPDDGVFPGIHNRPVDLKRFMSTHVKPICDELGIRGVSLHAVRHLNNAMMLSEGVDMKTRMDRLGHVSEN